MNPQVFARSTTAFAAPAVPVRGAALRSSAGSNAGTASRRVIRSSVNKGRRTSGGAARPAASVVVRAASAAPAAPSTAAASKSHDTEVRGGAG